MKGLRGLSSNTLDSTKYEHLHGHIHSQDILGMIMFPQATLYILKRAQTFTQLTQLVRSAVNMEAMLKQCD